MQSNSSQVPVFIQHPGQQIGFQARHDPQYKIKLSKHGPAVTQSMRSPNSIKAGQRLKQETSSNGLPGYSCRLPVIQDQHQTISLQSQSVHAQPNTGSTQQRKPATPSRLSPKPVTQDQRKHPVQSAASNKS